MKKNEPQEVYIGSVNLNFSKVDIYMCYEGGVHTDFKKTGEILLFLDINEEDWGIMVADLMHELLEIYFLKIGCRLMRSDLPISFEPIECSFMFNHSQFQLACHECGNAMSQILPKLYIQFCKLHMIN